MNRDYRMIVKNASVYRTKYRNVMEEKNIPCTAIVDTGIFMHRDIRARILGFYDTIAGQTTPYDDNGHGTHIAGIIGGSSRRQERYHGIFPEAKFFGVKALKKDGIGKVEDFIAGTDYLIQHRHDYHIRVINISLGAEYDHSDEQQALIDCVEYAWDCGIVVVAAAGNNGPERGSITVPGISKKIITVGTYDDDIPIHNPATGKKMAHYSGRGPTADCIVKPDILCPGTNILSLNNTYSGYTIKSGTSMSTPMLSGIISLVLSVCPDVTPKEIKIAVKAAHPEDSLRFDSKRFLEFF
jgi:serine protease AprX